MTKPKKSLDIEEAATWLELAGCVAHLPIAGLLQRLRDDDLALTDAIHAILSTDYRPSERLTALRDFLVQQLLGESFDAATDVPFAWRPESSPFAVPSRFIDVWFPPSTQEAMRGESPTSRMRIRQFYDCFDLTPELLTHTKLFGNNNVGNASRTNLQVAGQLTFNDTPMLITSWWITCPTWPRADEFFAKTCFTMVVGDKPEMLTPGLELVRRRQPLLVPVPPRRNFSVACDFYAHRNEDGPWPLTAVPVFVFIEGWGQASPR
jgi:hypothetical protein